MKRWFGQARDELVKTLARIISHNVTLVVVLLAEALAIYVLHLPGLESARALLEPLLLATMFLAVALSHTEFVITLALRFMVNVKKRISDAGGGVPAWCVLAVAVLAIGFAVRVLNQRPVGEATASATMPAPKVAVLQLPPRLRSMTGIPPELRWPADTDTLRLGFFVAVQSEHEYVAELDARLLLRLEFRADGQLELLILRSLLKDGSHQLRVFKHRHDDEAFTPIETYQFRTTSGD
jgi:hypothetical protein